MKETYCHYESAWVPLGRARTRCPICGAEMRLDKNNLENTLFHPVREITKEPEKEVHKSA